MLLNSKTNTTSLQSNSAVGNLLFTSVKAIVKRRSTPWIGTMTDLKSLIEQRVENLPSNWATTPSVFRMQLNKVVNRLRNAGISVKFIRSTDKNRTRLVRFSVSN